MPQGSAQYNRLASEGSQGSAGNKPKSRDGGSQNKVGVTPGLMGTDEDFDLGQLETIENDD